MNRERLRALLADFPGQSVHVLGDAILDRYIIGRSQRLSREAPVPVLEQEEERQILGGGANPAANLAALGAAVEFVSALGVDEEGATLRRLLTAAGVRDTATLALDGRLTTVKTRILARSDRRSPQQLARLDRGAQEQALAASEEEQLCSALLNLPPAAALLCSDYAGGVLSAAILSTARAKAARDGALLCADAQGRLAHYGGFDCVKCNAAEAEAEWGERLMGDDDYAAAAAALRAHLDCRLLVITRGAAGATLAENGATPQHIDAPNVTDVYDTVGAGDTAIAIMTLALLVGAKAAEAVILANLAGGIVVRHFGNHKPTLAELRAVLG